MNVKKTLTLALSLIASSALGASVILAWDESPDTNVVAYQIYWGTATRTYPTKQFVEGRSLVTTTIPNLQPGVTYYFAATCLSSIGLESDFSNEVVYTVPTNAFRLRSPLKIYLK